MVAMRISPRVFQRLKTLDSRGGPQCLFITVDDVLASAVLLQRREGGMLLAILADFLPDAAMTEAEAGGYFSVIGPVFPDALLHPSGDDAESTSEVLVIGLSLYALVKLRKADMLSDEEMETVMTFSGVPLDNSHPEVEEWKEARTLGLDSYSEEARQSSCVTANSAPGPRVRQPAGKASAVIPALPLAEPVEVAASEPELVNMGQLATGLAQLSSIVTALATKVQASFQPPPRREMIAGLLPVGVQSSGVAPFVMSGLGKGRLMVPPLPPKRFHDPRAVAGGLQPAGASGWQQASSSWEDSPDPEKKRTIQLRVR